METWMSSSGLVDKSLVLAEDTPLGTRYRMLETLREFAQERLAAANEEDTYRRRHASVCLQTTLTLVHNFLTNRDQLASLTLADAEFDNVREAIAWSIINDHELGGLLVGSTFEYAMVRANRVEVQEWSRALLAHFDDMSVPARASFGACAGNMIAYAGDVDTGLDLLEAALAAAREGGDARSLINALTGTALVKRLFRNDLATAEELLREAVQVADEFEVTLHRAHARVLLSWTVPEDDEARRLLEEGMELARVTGNRYSEMEALATYASHLPPDAETEGRLRRSLQLCRMFGEVQLTLEVRQQLAVFDASRSGDGDRLTEELTELAEEARKLGHPRLAANASRSVANAHRRAGRFDEARRWLATARGGHPAPVALVSALIQRDEGDPAGAGRDLRRSLRAAVDEIGGPLPSQTPDVLVDMTAVEAADPSADPRATAVMYWSGRAALETGTEWDGLKSFADWEETLQLLSSRLSTEEMAAAEAEGRSRDPAELWDWWLDHRLPQD